MTLKSNKKLITKIGLLVGLIIIASLLLTGCVQGMSPIGWSGVAVDNNIAFMGSKEGRLVSVNLSNAAKQYAESLKASSSGGAGCASSGSSGGACGGAPPAIAIYGTPALASNIPGLPDAAGNYTTGTIVIIAGYNGKVIAYNTVSLQQVWQFPIDTNLAPIISAVVVSGNTVYFGCNDGNVYALDAARGTKKWQSPTGGEIWSTPVIDNNLLFIGSFDKKIYAMDANTGEKKWEFPTGANNVAPVVVVDGIVYAGSLDRNFYAINETNGQEIWRYSAGGWFWAKPVALNGFIYAPCLDHKLYVLNAKTGDSPYQYDLQGQLASWPVIVDNRVIVANGVGSIWNIDTSNPNAQPTSVSITNNNLDITSPLSAVGNIVYINGPDNNLYSYDLTRNTVSTLASLSSQ